MNRNGTWLKIKDWLEVKMPASPFINVCAGLSMLILAFGAAVWLSSSVILTLLG